MRPRTRATAADEALCRRSTLRSAAASETSGIQRAADSKTFERGRCDHEVRRDDMEFDCLGLKIDRILLWKRGPRPNWTIVDSWGAINGEINVLAWDR